jgi:hypothetical protein
MSRLGVTTLFQRDQPREREDGVTRVVVVHGRSKNIVIRAAVRAGLDSDKSGGAETLGGG